MLVSKLIEELERFKSDSEIRFIGIIESGRSLSWVDVKGCILEEEDGVVLLKVSGDLNEDGGCE